MTRTRHQIVVSQAVQQLVHAGQRVDLAKALLDPLPQDRAVVRRDPFLRRRSRVQHCHKLRFLLNVEPTRCARLTLGDQRVDAALAVTSNPLVHELARAADRRGDLLALQLRLIAQPSASDQHDAVTIPLLGVACRGDPLVQALLVGRAFPIHLHARPPWRRPNHARSRPWALPNMRRTAREI